MLGERERERKNEREHRGSVRVHRTYYRVLRNETEQLTHATTADSVSLCKKILSKKRRRAKRSDAEAALTFTVHLMLLFMCPPGGARRKKKRGKVCLP